jgi:hypothetical protein
MLNFQRSSIPNCLLALQSTPIFFPKLFELCPRIIHRCKVVRFCISDKSPRALDFIEICRKLLYLDSTKSIWSIQQSSIEIVKLRLSVSICLQVILNFKPLVECQKNSGDSRDDCDCRLGEVVALDALRQDWD